MPGGHPRSGEMVNEFITLQERIASSTRLRRRGADAAPRGRDAEDAGEAPVTHVPYKGGARAREPHRWADPVRLENLPRRAAREAGGCARRALGSQTLALVPDFERSRRAGLKGYEIVAERRLPPAPPQNIVAYLRGPR